MMLVEIINTQTQQELGTFIFCQQHFAELNGLPASLFRVRELTRFHVVGECIKCTEGQATPITFDETPDNIDVYVTFDNNEGAQWSASGKNGHLTYITDGNGHYYTTIEALKRRGVAKLYIETGFEVHLDD